MADTNKRNVMDEAKLDLALKSLAIRLKANKAGPFGLVVCGGSALILTGLVIRTTQDVDVVALMQGGMLVAPDPIPAELAKAAHEVAEDLNLQDNWLNNGPSRGVGGLFQTGLPEGFAARLQHVRYGDLLDVYFIHRIDQIHFKLYAAADRGGYHITDLEALAPSTDELVSAARWAMTHDVSEPFALVLRHLLTSIGHEDAASRI